LVQPVIRLLDPRDPEAPFPDPEEALPEPNGLLAVGGDLSPARLLRAYREGIFPWFNEGEPILWWSPDPRLVLFPERLKISRSLRKTLKKRPFVITFDRAFAEVVRLCAETRPGGTWITPEMRDAYIALHRLGHAHSVEAWREGRLVGGLYGVSVGRLFSGESMFHLLPDASKVAFVHFVRWLQAWDYALIDCQVETGHLKRFGAEPIPRHRFLAFLRELRDQAPSPKAWREPVQVAPSRDPPRGAGKR